MSLYHAGKTRQLLWLSAPFSGYKCAKNVKSSDCAPNWLTGVTLCDAMWSFFRPDNAYDCIIRNISEGKYNHYARLEKTTFILMLQKADCGLTAVQIRVVILKCCFTKRLSNTFLTLQKKNSESGISQQKKPSVFTGNRRLIPGLRFPEFQGII